MVVVVAQSIQAFVAIGFAFKRIPDHVVEPEPTVRACPEVDSVENLTCSGFLIGDLLLPSHLDEVDRVAPPKGTQLIKPSAPRWRGTTPSPACRPRSLGAAACTLRRRVLHRLPEAALSPAPWVGCSSSKPG